MVGGKIRLSNRGWVRTINLLILLYQDGGMPPLSYPIKNPMPRKARG